MTTNKPENSDRELLELAAKAAGYDTSHQWNADRMEMDPPVASLCIPGVSTAWNTLEEDGDALRLAVRLGITISFWGDLEEVATYTPDYGTPAAQESYSQGKAVATRRAIVGAAAEMGRDKL